MKCVPLFYVFYVVPLFPGRFHFNNHGEGLIFLLHFDGSRRRNPAVVLLRAVSLVFEIMAPNYPPIVAWSYAIAFLLVLTAANAGKTIRRAQDTPAVPPASLDAIATCSADNWGMPNQKRPPYRTTYQTDIQQACKAAFHKDNMRPMAHVLENATVNHYMNNKDFDAFIGIDMVPDNHNLYKVTGIWGHSLEYKHVRRDYMKAATCENQLEDGSTWTVTRIGPMKTRVWTYLHLVLAVTPSVICVVT
jgi:hypothetical protein